MQCAASAHAAAAHTDPRQSLKVHHKDGFTAAGEVIESLGHCKHKLAETSAEPSLTCKQWVHG